MNIIVWHRKDLRSEDNKALSEAAKKGKVLPVYIFDPKTFSRDRSHCNDWYFFLFECLTDLDEQYKKLGTRLALLWGDPCVKLNELARKHSAMLYFNKYPGNTEEIQRDKKLLSVKGAKAWDNDGVMRMDDDRRGWFQRCEQYFEDTEMRTPSNLSLNTIKSEINVNELIRKYSIYREKHGVPKGGLRTAKRRLNYFIDNMDNYTVKENPFLLTASGDFQLSAYITLGTLSIRTIYKEVNKSIKRSKSLYLNRLFWNQHFKQKMQNFPEMDERAVNPVYENLYEKMYSYNPELVTAWKSGNTGFPAVDFAMKVLVKTGFISFELRKMVTSFFCYILKQPWKLGADFMYYHLIDADRAVNYAWWQIIAGTVGAYDNLIIDPERFRQKYDPDDTFISRYITQTKINKGGNTGILSKNNTMYGRTPGSVTKPNSTGPVVDFESEYIKAVNIYNEVNKKAFPSLSDPEVFKRANIYGVIKKMVLKGRMPEIKKC